MSEAAPGAVEVFAPRGRVARIFVFSWLFVAASVYFLVRGGSATRLIVGWIGLVFFGACAIYALYRWAVPSPILVVDAEGIDDRASGVAVGRVPWEQVVDVRITKMARQRFVSIYVRDPDAITQRLPALKRRVVAINQKMGFAPVNIPVSVLPMPAEDFVETLREHLHARA